MSGRAWNAADRQAFRDGQRLRAQTVPSRRFNGPTLDEWDTGEDDDDTTVLG